MLDSRYTTTINAPTVSKDPEPLNLSPREWETARLIVEGLPNKIIADRMGISFHTVRFHIRQLFAKLGVTNRTEIAVKMARAGY